MRKSIAALAATTLGASSAVLISAVLPGVAAASCAEAITVTSDNTQGWRIPDTGNTNGGGTATFDQTDENNLVLNPGTGKVTVTYPISVAGIPLVDQTAQSNYDYTYQRFAGDANAAGAPSYQLTLDFNGAEPGGFTTLVYEPVYQGANPNTWWSTRALDNIENRGGHGSPDFGTLAEISAAYPNAVIQAFGITQASTNGSPSSLDSVKFGCNVFNFDAGVAAPVNQAPVAILDATGPTPQGVVTFTAPSTDDKGVVRQTLDFGDGTSTEGGPNDRGPIDHTYAPGTYTATLTAYDAEGLSSTDTFTFTYVLPNDGIANGPLAGTGADVVGLASIGGILLVGSVAGAVITRRRKASASA